MDKEDYVSLEVAKLLKEKGFEEECRCLYQSIRDDDKEDDCFRYSDDICFKNRKEDKKIFAAPSLRQAKYWLMLNHNIFIYWVCKKINVWSDEVIYQYSIVTNLSNADCLIKFSDVYYSSLREAMNEGFLEALKLI